MDYTKIFKAIRSNKLFLYISPFIIYLIIAFILWGPSHFTEIHRAFFTPSGDPESYVWYLRWWPYSLAHGLNPIFERFVYYPNGFNLAWSTSIPTLALIMSPITAIWGALTSFNIIAIAALPFSALCCYYLIYYLTHKYWASVLCGFIYGFSSFQLAELLGHPCFYVSFVVPLVVLLVILRVRDRLRRIAFIILLAILLVLQFGIATEGLGSLCLFGIAGWILICLFADKKLRARLLKISLEMVVAVGLMLVVISPFIYYLIKGYSGVPKIINSSIGYSSDLLNYIIPTKITLIGGSLFQHISNNFTGNASEQGAYLGIPLILFLIGFSIYYWRRWYVKVLAIMVGIIGLSSLGPVLQINGKHESLTLPWAIAVHLPVLRSMLPTRFPQYLFLLAAIMLGLWIANSPKATKKRGKKKVKLMQTGKYLLVVIVIALILPAPSNYIWAKPNVPALFTPKLTREYIGIGKNILILPLSNGADPELWEVTSNMEFRTTDGYLGFVPAFVIGSPITVQVSSDLPGPNFVSNFLGFCKTNQISEIIYTPIGLPKSIAIVKTTEALGWTSFDVGGATIIKVPLQYQ